jgi:hypothetical protein
MRRVKRFFTVTALERRLLLRALWRLSRTCLTLHLVPQKKWRPLLAPGVKPATLPRRRYSELQIAWAVRAAARYVPTANCLPQAIVAKQFLEEQGFQPVIRIGVEAPGVDTPEELGLKAHAWVETGGRVVLGDDGRDYQALRATP